MMNSIYFLQLLTPDQSQRNRKGYLKIARSLLALFYWNDFRCNKNIVVKTGRRMKNFHPEFIKLNLVFKIECFLNSVKD